jgi:hypothetical protein
MFAARVIPALLLGLTLVARAEVQKYVTVIDSEEKPVIGLSTEDFYLREGGLRLGLLMASPASEPLEIAVVIDGFAANERTPVTSAVAAATKQLTAASPRHHMTVRDTAAGTPFIANVLDAAASLQTSDTDRLIVLAIVKRRAGDGNVDEPSRLTYGLLDSHVSLWTIELGAEQSTPLDRAITTAVTNGGGLREIARSDAGISEAAKHIVELLTSQYVITYRWPNPMLSDAFYITTRHERGEVLATKWTR